jgi:hypothetical protein
MSQNLHSATVAAIDELHSLIRLQQLLEIALAIFCHFRRFPRDYAVSAHEKSRF